MLRAPTEILAGAAAALITFGVLFRMVLDDIWSDPQSAPIAPRGYRGDRSLVLTATG
jgi:hypothetical protein